MSPPLINSHNIFVVVPLSEAGKVARIYSPPKDLLTYILDGEVVQGEDLLWKDLSGGKDLWGSNLGDRLTDGLLLCD